MGTYWMLKRAFGFLAKVYGFEIRMKQPSGSYSFITWTNANVDIMVMYDLTDRIPMSIRVYDADSFGFDAAEYKEEFAQTDGTPREQIRRAAEWLRNAIADKRILI